jgi:hypothetical protein
LSKHAKDIAHIRLDRRDAYVMYELSGCLFTCYSTVIEIPSCMFEIHRARSSYQFSRTFYFFTEVP